MLLLEKLLKLMIKRYFFLSNEATEHEDYPELKKKFRVKFYKNYFMMKDVGEGDDQRVEVVSDFIDDSQINMPQFMMDGMLKSVLPTQMQKIIDDAIVYHQRINE